MLYYRVGSGLRTFAKLTPKNFLCNWHRLAQCVHAHAPKNIGFRSLPVEI